MQAVYHAAQDCIAFTGANPLAKRDFNVIVVHGHGSEWRKIKRYIQQAGFTARVLDEEYKAGVILNRWRNLVWDEIHCAVIVMTRDDRIASQRYRARQNVIFELGYCFGAFDSLDDDGSYTAEDAIIVVAEDGVERFANIDGLTTIQFRKGQLGRQRKVFVSAIQAAFQQGQTFYPEL